MDRSISALVREYLVRLVSEEREFHRLKALQNETIAKIKGFRATDRVSRDKLHER